MHTAVSGVSPVVPADRVTIDIRTMNTDDAEPEPEPSGIMDDEFSEERLGLDYTAKDIFGSDVSPLAADAESELDDDPGTKRQRLEVEDVASSPVSASGPSRSSAIAGVGHLTLKSADMGQFKFPWEKGSLARVFMDEPAISVPVPKIQPGRNANFKMTLEVSEGAKTSPVINLDTKVRDANFFAGVVKSAADMSYKQERAKKRMEVIEEWWYLLATSISNSTVGVQVTAEASVSEAKEVGCRILDACFSLKSPGTLKKRLSGLKGFYTWHRTHGEGNWLPMTERDAWLYVNFLKRTEAPATTASTFLESCRFAWFVLGVAGAGSIESSLRVKGMSAQLKTNKRAWCPAEVLKLTEVKRLHQVLHDDAHHVIDRIFAGHCLHLLYGRCRWSDMLAVQNGFVDDHEQFLELETKVHKSARSADAKAKLMPIVAPCVGVVDGTWAKTYLELRKKSGLDMPRSDAMHMLPAPADSSGTFWHGRYLTSEEGSEFLRAILDVPKKKGRRIRSHSLKSTTISWTSKFGIPMEARTVLARYTTALQNPTVMYSRDLQTPVLREYVAMLAAIRSGGFLPDASRSGMVFPEKIPSMPGIPSNLVGRAKIQTPAARRAGDGKFGESEIESPRAANMDGAENESAVGDGRMNAADRFLSGLASEDRVEVESDLSKTTEEASVQSTSSDDRDGGDAAFEEPVEESA